MLQTALLRIQNSEEINLNLKTLMWKRNLIFHSCSFHHEISLHRQHQKHFLNFSELKSVSKVKFPIISKKTFSLSSSHKNFIRSFSVQSLSVSSFASKTLISSTVSCFSSHKEYFFTLLESFNKFPLSGFTFESSRCFQGKVSCLLTIKTETAWKLRKISEFNLRPNEKCVYYCKLRSANRQNCNFPNDFHRINWKL